MSRYLVFVLVALVMLGAAFTYLMTSDVSAPTHHVEQVIPNDRLGH